MKFSVSAPRNPPSSFANRSRQRGHAVFISNQVVKVLPEPHRGHRFRKPRTRARVPLTCG